MQECKLLIAPRNNWLIIRPFKKVITFVKQWDDKTIDRPRDWISFILISPVALLLTLFLSNFFSWLPGIDIDSARWALSTEAQATAAILALLVASAVFRLSSISSREPPLRELLDGCVKNLSLLSNIENKNVMDTVYDEYALLTKNQLKVLKSKKQKTNIYDFGSPLDN